MYTFSQVELCAKKERNKILMFQLGFQWNEKKSFQGKSAGS